MPIKDPEKRREYMRKYEEERRLGLRRKGSLTVVEAEMEERAAARRGYLRTYAREHAEKIAQQRRERERAKRQARQAAALRARFGQAVDGGEAMNQPITKETTR